MDTAVAAAAVTTAWLLLLLLPLLAAAFTSTAVPTASSNASTDSYHSCKGMLKHIDSPQLLLLLQLRQLERRQIGN